MSSQHVNTRWLRRKQEERWSYAHYIITNFSSYLFHQNNLSICLLVKSGIFAQMPGLMFKLPRQCIRGFINYTNRMSSNSAKTLFTDTGLIGDGSVALMVGAPAERHLEKVSKFIQRAAQHTQVCKIDRFHWSYWIWYLCLSVFVSVIVYRFLKPREGSSFVESERL